MNNKLNLSLIAITTLTTANVNAQTFYQCLPITCKDGQYIDGNTCKNCPAGTFQKGNNKATSCSPCSAGYYSSTGSSSCSICPAGTYSSIAATSCSKCPAGTYNKNTGSTSQNNCLPCPAYKWSNAGSTSCGQVFVAMTLSDYKDVNKGILNNYFLQWVNIGSFVDNRYCTTGTASRGFYMHHKNGWGDPGGNDDYGSFGVTPRRAISVEHNARDWLQGNCSSFPCTITRGNPVHSSTTIDPAKMLISSKFTDGAIYNISGAIKIVNDSSYWGKCFGPK